MSARPLRFAFVTTFYPPYNFGGDGIFVQRLAAALAARGHTVEVVHCRDAYRLLAGGEPAEGYRDPPGVTVHGLEHPLGRLSPLVTQQTGRPGLKGPALRRLLGRPHDVIHYHNVSLVGGPGVLRLGRGVKLYTTHEYWLVCPTHVLFKFGRTACRRRACLVCVLAHRRPPQLWRYTGWLRRCLRHVDRLLAPSRFAAERHAHLGVPVEVLPNFVPRPAAPPAPLPGVPAPPPPYFAFLGRLEPLKGVQTLLPLFREFREAELWVAGTGSRAAGLRRAAPPNVRFLGRLTEGQVRTLLGDALAVVVPSLCYETYGLVTVEAFREGTPAVVRDLGALPETVTASGAGFTYRDEGELRTLLRRLLEHPSLRRDLGRRARTAYERCYTPEVYLQRYLALVTALRREKGVRP